MDNPFIPPPLTAKTVTHDLKDEKIIQNDFDASNISSKVLYDRLEDQNLQLASQIQKHQEELDAFFAKMSTEASKLSTMINRVNNKEQSEAKQNNQSDNRLR